MLEEKCKKLKCAECPKVDTCTKKHFKNIFTKYGYYTTNLAETGARFYLQHPEELHKKEDVLHYLQKIDGYKKELEELKKQLDAYAAEMTERYNFLLLSPTKEKIVLQRKKDTWKNLVYYFIVFYSVNLNDGHETETERIKFKGTERKQAFQKFKELQNANKNAIFEEKI